MCSLSGFRYRKTTVSLANKLPLNFNSELVDVLVSRSPDGDGEGGTATTRCPHPSHHNVTASPLEAGPSNLNAHPQPSCQSAPPTSLRSASLQGPTPSPAYTVGGEPLISRREYDVL